METVLAQGKDWKCVLPYLILRVVVCVTAIVAATAWSPCYCCMMYILYSHTQTPSSTCVGPHAESVPVTFPLLKHFLLPSIQLPEAPTLRHSPHRTAHPKLECRPVFVYLIDLFHQLKIINLPFYFLKSRLTLQKSNTTVVSLEVPLYKFVAAIAAS